MSTYQKAFTLIELVIVNAIIGVLAAIAISSYQDFVGRAQIVDAVVLLNTSRIDVEEHILEVGHFPGDEKFASLNTGRSGLYTDNLDIAVANTCSTAGVIRATIKVAGVSANIAGRTFVIERDIDGNWRCARGWDNSLEDKYLPESCHIAPVPEHEYPICPLFKTGEDMPVGGGDNSVVASANDDSASDSSDSNNGNGNGGHGNNGHGNNYDSVDVSNPGRGKGKKDDASGDVDDEMR